MEIFPALPDATVVPAYGSQRGHCMKRATLFFTLFGLLLFIGGCKKQESDSDAIRSGINEHLASLKTINLSAMDMSITNVSVQGNQAQAQVEFRPKTGAPPGAGMQVAYTLAKQDDKWVVQNTQPMGGMIQHPAPGQNPHQTTTSPSSTQLPNFSDLVGSPSGTSLPPGHPAVNPQGKTTSPAPSYSPQ